MIQKKEALKLLEDAIQKAEMLFVASTSDDKIVKSLMLDLQKLKNCLDKQSPVLSDEGFWLWLSSIFDRLVKLLLESFFE